MRILASASVAHILLASVLFAQVQNPAAGRTDLEQADSMFASALRQRSQGLYDRAAAYLEHVVEVRRRLLGDEAPAVLVAMGELASTYESMGDLGRAGTLYQHVLSIHRRTLGFDHLETARSYVNLGRVFEGMGDYARAKSFFEEALPTLIKGLGPGDREITHASVLLAVAHANLGNHEGAEFLYQGALAFHEDAYGENDPYVASILTNLGALYLTTLQLDRAAPLFERALAIRRASLAERHPSLALSLRTVAMVHFKRGDYARAEGLYQEALDIARTTAGHPGLAGTLAGLADVHAARGDDARAEPCLREALDASIRTLDLASAAQSERQLVAMTEEARRYLDRYLALALRGSAPVDVAWSYAVAWKGRGMARQASVRAAVHDEETRALFTALQKATSELSQLALGPAGRNVPEAYELKQRMAALSEQKERLERVLAGKARRVDPIDAAAIRSSLPDDAILLDGLEAGGRIAIFVVAREGSITLIDLGSAATLADSVDRWHTLTKSGVESDAIAKRLRELVWSPVEKSVASRKLVIVSPEGVLSRIAFGALPSQVPGRYLVEERAIAVIPAPRMIPNILNSPPAHRPAVGMLAVGDVDYDREKQTGASDETTSPSARAGSSAFEALPATRKEIDQVGALYRGSFGTVPVTLMRGADAGERAIREQADRFSHLHFATHGFFADARFLERLARSGDRSFSLEPNGDSSIAGYHPGLLSGLVFAGANRPTAAEDGILTAEEVATLDLSGVEMTVLSACESSLGQSAGSEGVLGLQRAFHAAGARTVVATLWQVDDESTRVLMQRFYENLWARKMGRLEALREAQLWMLNDGRKPPFHWAAFILSGDWR